MPLELGLLLSLRCGKQQRIYGMEVGSGRPTTLCFRMPKRICSGARRPHPGSRPAARRIPVLQASHTSNARI
jgi:hypothetical protein